MRFEKGHTPWNKGTPFEGGFKKGYTPWNKGKTGLLSSWNAGIKMSKEHCLKISRALKGRLHSAQHNKNVSIALTGKKLSEEHRRRISEVQKGRVSPFKGIKRSDDFKIKLAASMKKAREEGRWVSPMTGKGNPTAYKIYRAKVLRDAGPLYKKLVQIIYEDNIKKYGTLTCYICSNSIEFGNDTIEHKIPLSRGGKNQYDNLEISCKKCNYRKHNKTFEEYQKYCDQKGKI